MPRISEFFGIVIAMYYNDHVPPHFHAKYAEHEAQVVIESLALLHGSLPRRALAMVLEWAAIHRDELRANWEAAHAVETIVSAPGIGASYEIGTRRLVLPRFRTIWSSKSTTTSS